MKYRYTLISSVTIITAAIMGNALVPPPPANQFMGIIDTAFTDFTENMCRDCHTSGVSESHHLMADKSCSICHLMNGSQMTIVKNCKQCHSTKFNGISVRIPHHETKNAQDRHCSFCHGNIVDDYDDGHYIPTYDISFTTPSPKYKTISETGEKFGGCEACHENNSEQNISSNNETHHSLGSLSGFSPQDSSKCIICHKDGSGDDSKPDSIRYCEKCHSVRSLHNIQPDFINTSGTVGHGHVGSGWDCDKCHAFWISENAIPVIGTIIPIIDKISSSKIYVGNSTSLVINGDNFYEIINNKTYSSVVVLVNRPGNNITTLTPSSITNTQIVVTIPSMSRGGYGIYVLKNGSMKSKKLPMVSAPDVIVSTAKKNDNTITILGSGFGGYDSLYQKFVNVTIKYVNRRGATIFRNVQVSDWSDIAINVSSTDAEIGDIVTVNSIFGSNSTTITAGTTPTPTPTPTGTSTPTPTPIKTPRPTPKPK